MAVNLAVLNGLVEKFRKGSPNIAAAFDETGKLLTKVDAELWGAVGDLSSRVAALEGEEPPPPPPPPGAYTVSQNVVGTGGAVSGSYGWAATPSDVTATAKVEFLVDGTVKATDTSSPYGYFLDTTSLTNGDHAWVVRATATDGRVATNTQTVTVNNGAAPPPPPPPPTTDVLFNGDWSTGNFSQWKENTSLDQGAVVQTSAGYVFRARTAAQKGASICHVGNQLADYWLPFELIPSDVWHGLDVLVPDGTNPEYPGILQPATPGSGWNIIWEVHNRTDGASGYNYPGTTPGSYVSTVLTVKSENDGTTRWQLRMSGGTLTGPVHSYNQTNDRIVPNRWYKHRIRIKHGHTTGTGFFEWWVDGVKVAEAATPTAYLCDDGKSGERLQVGLYRGESFTQTGTVYLKGMRVGTTKAAVGG